MWFAIPIFALVLGITSSFPVRRLPVVYQISTRPWLYELAESGMRANCGEYVCLRDVPLKEWKRFADLGVDMIWLMGVWQLGEVGLNEDKSTMWRWKPDLPDAKPDDVIGSPYAIVNYTVNLEIGSDEELAEVRRLLGDLGIQLMLDFVPNHSAKDATWLATHPDIYLEKPMNDDSPNDWWQKVGDKWLAHGRSPYDLWTDTLQLNYWSPATRKLMIDVLLHIASHSDGIRCDMGMLALNDVWQRAWGRQMWNARFPRPSEEFWAVAIRAVKAKFPDTIFLVEAYDYHITSPPELQFLANVGFDYVYDKGVLDRLHKSGTLTDLRGYVAGRANLLPYTAHFVENHDEPRAAASLGGPQQAFVGSVVAATMPGLRLFNHGQFEGLTAKLAVQLRRPQHEQRNATLHAMYARLLSILDDPVFHDGIWTNIAVADPQCPKHSNAGHDCGWSGITQDQCEAKGCCWDPSSGRNWCYPREFGPIPGVGWRVEAWRWSYDTERRLIVVNFGPEKVLAKVLVDEAEGDGSVNFIELLSGDATTEVALAQDLRGNGLNCNLQPWSAKIFKYWSSIESDLLIV